MSVLLLIFTPFIFAVLTPVLAKFFPFRFPKVLSFLIVVYALGIGVLAHTVFLEGAYQWSVPWVPGLGIEFSTYIDGLSALYLVLVSAMGALIVLYSEGYFINHPRKALFYSLLFFFMGSMMGLVASDHLVVLFVFWELTSISSFLLIAFQHEKEKARKAAVQALIITGAGGLSLLAGAVLIGIDVGTMKISEILASPHILRESAMYLPILVLLLMGAFTKSAQVPIHFWLPNAMAAPTPVSAYLHSAAMVKAGIFLLLRLYPALGGTREWQGILIITGSLTAVVGPLMALRQTDLKKLLAYSTIGSLGLLVMLIGVGTELAIGAAVLYLLIHSMYKGALFMVAGSVDQYAGTRNVLGLEGLRLTMPITAAAAGLAALSMAGVPPFIGFIGKELIYQTKLESEAANWFFSGLGIFANMATAAVAFVVGMEPFVGRRSISVKAASEPSRTMWLGPLILSILGLLIGLFPHLIDDSLLRSAATAAHGNPVDLVLKSWHGFNEILFLSVITLVGGVFLFSIRKQIRQMEIINEFLERLGPQKIYDLFVESLLREGLWLTQLIQNGSLGRYLSILISTTAVFISWILIRHWSQIEGSVFQWSVPLYEAMICLVTIFGALLVAATRSPVTSLLGVGIVGFSVTVIYVLYSAPDLAMTQVLVETIGVILTIFLVSQLPAFSQKKNWIKEGSRWVISISMGVLMAILAGAMTFGGERFLPVSEFFRDNSLSEARGKNIVNVILVDFRAFDTLGETTVVVISALGVLSLLLFAKRQQKGADPL